MKFILSKQAIIFNLLALTAVVIWFVGPFIPIENSILKSSLQRAYVVAAFFLIGVLQYLFWPDNQKNKPKIALSPLVLKKLNLLQKRFHGAIFFLKKTIVNKHGTNVPLAELPWQLVIGPRGSGKTSLLAHCGVNFILSKQFKEEELSKIQSSETCDWWVTRDQVLIDIPGYYLISKTDEKKNEDMDGIYLWQQFLTLVKQSKQKTKLTSVVITIHLPELMSTHNNETLINLIRSLKKRINDLIETFGLHLSFYLVITKCDLLPGFTEFFSESGSDELTQAWGISLPPRDVKEKLTDVFVHRFNALIKRLNKQVIWRLHQERNPNARPFIKDFPLQVERLKENIHFFLKALMIPQLPLQGVYLTSALQTNTEDNTGITQPFPHQSLQINRSALTTSQSYFIKQLILQGLLAQSDYSHPISKSVFSQKRAIFATSMSVMLCAAFLMGYDFQKHAEKTYRIQNDLTHYQLYVQQAGTGTERLTKALPLLRAFRQSSSDNKAISSFSFFSKTLDFFSTKSKKTADLSYQQLLQNIVLPEVKDFLESYLKNANEKNPEYVYAALKAYLMLNNPSIMQSNFVASTINHLSHLSMSKQALGELSDHIAIAFQNTTIELNNNLIMQVRKQLMSLPPLESAMIILKNMNENNGDSAISLGTNLGTPPVFISQEISNNIPNMFTAEQFKTIVSQEVNIAALETLQGNLVLGKITPNVNQPAISELVSQLRARYIANYLDVWESLIANIRLYTPKDLLQADHMIVNLTGNHSPLLELLQTIKENTAFPPINSESPKIQALNNLLEKANNHQQNPLFQIFSCSQQLHHYLEIILTAKDTKEAAFNLAQNRLKQINNDPISQIHQFADQNPEPMKTWFHGIANEVWHFILQEAANHIDDKWQQTILPVYNIKIANHYPFNQEATKEVDLESFSELLGAQGKLSQFFQTFLKVFVNDSDKQWVWKTMENQKIPLSDHSLLTFQQAFKLQKAFFPNGDNTLFVPFTLHPVSLDPTMKSFTLNINGQQMTYQKNEPRSPRLLTWPGTNKLHETTLHFISPDNQLTGDTHEGNWGWFRLVTQSTQTIKSRKELLLNFSVNGHSAKYLLFTEGHINPFLPLNLSRFELPQELI